MMSQNPNVPLLALLLLLVGSSQAIKLTLKASTQIIPIEGALNFSLTCSVVEDPSEEPGLTEVFRLAIAKFQDNVWTRVVSMDSSWKTPFTHEGLNGDAFFSENSHQSLSLTSVTVTWPNATNETSGHYNCEVIGYDRSGWSSVQLRTRVRVEAEVPLTLFQIAKMLQSSMKIQKDISKTQKGIISDMDTMKRLLNESIDTKENLSERLNISEETCNDAMTDIAILDNRINSSETVLADTRTDIDALKTKVDAYKVFENIDINALVTNVSQNQKRLKSLPQWPEGAYSLLQPVTGCPNNYGVAWEMGFGKSHTESTSGNFDSVSMVMHMKKPVKEKVGSNNFMTQHFCTVSTPTGHVSWPAGTYCIMKVPNNNCPSGFQEGLIITDDEDTRANVDIDGTTPVFEHSSGLLKINYCCRSDFNASYDILLPTAKPFYLHRYQGVRQKVSGMRVSGEFLFFTPEVIENDSKYTGAHPDDKGYLPNVRLELCYSEKL